MSGQTIRCAQALSCLGALVLTQGMRAPAAAVDGTASCADVTACSAACACGCPDVLSHACGRGKLDGVAAG